jgi:hypothetical protein
MDAATITAEHAAARSFLSYLKVEQATTLSNQIGVDAMLASDPDNAHLKNALVRAVGLLAQADGDVAAQVTAIRNLRAAAPQAPPAGPSPTTTRRSGRELSPPPVPTKKARFSIATAARKIAHPHDDLWLDAQGKIHLVNLAKAARLNLRLDQIWALVDGIAAMLVASGIAAPLSAEVDLLGEAFEDVEPCALSPEQIRAALQEIASALEVPALALLHTTLEEGITLNVRHTHGAAVARAFCSTDPLEELDGVDAKKLAHALKLNKSAKPRSGEEHAPARERRWLRDNRQRDREPRRSPPREQRRDNDRPSRDQPQPRANPSNVQCRRCGKDGHFAKDCRRP